MTVREIDAPKARLRSEAARRHVARGRDRRQAAGRFAAEDAEAGEPPRVTGDGFVDREEGNEGAVDAESKAPVVAERLREGAQGVGESSPLLAREPLSEVVEGRRAPGGLVAKQLRLARAERSRAA